MAVDPVCGMDVEPGSAAAVSDYNGQKYYFCAVSCKERFDADPGKYLGCAAPAKAGWFSRLLGG